jgi:hypothetical protein
LVDLTVGNERTAADDGMVVAGRAFAGAWETAVVGVALGVVGIVEGVEGVAEAAVVAAVVADVEADVGVVEGAVDENDDDVAVEEERSGWALGVFGVHRHC